MFISQLSIISINTNVYKLIYINIHIVSYFEVVFLYFIS